MNRGTATTLLGHPRTTKVIHILSGGAEPHRALCGAKIAVYVGDGVATCSRCIERNDEVARA